MGIKKSVEADAVLTEAIKQETLARIADITAVLAAVDAESEARTTADDAFDTLLKIEIANRKADVQAEHDARAHAIKSEQDARTHAIKSEQDARKEADSALVQLVNAEADVRAKAVEAEAKTRKEADIAVEAASLLRDLSLANDIKTLEAVTATAVERLVNAINAEAAASIERDNGLADDITKQAQVALDAVKAEAATRLTEDDKLKVLALQIDTASASRDLQLGENLAQEVADRITAVSLEAGLRAKAVEELEGKVE